MSASFARQVLEVGFYQACAQTNAIEERRKTGERLPPIPARPGVKPAPAPIPTPPRRGLRLVNNNQET